jgi:hypothetical protein
VAVPPDKVIDAPGLEPSTRMVTEPVGVPRIAVEDATAGATVMVMTSLVPTVGLGEADVRVVVELERLDAEVVGHAFRN